MPVEKFIDLEVWKEAHRLVLTIYRVTKSFPSEEKFGLVSQMRRCAVSITSNIAEGFSRYSSGHKSQLYTVALGSLTELTNQIYIARDVGFVLPETASKVLQQLGTVHRLLHGLLRSIRKR
ncbi:MAG: four helix bundle protein [Candidatus Kerfeldbacteria bacterium]|nr:four helix bundle protein [Candidatus Kerfeldbacteria bacterium]